MAFAHDARPSHPTRLCGLDRRSFSLGIAFSGRRYGGRSTVRRAVAAHDACSSHTRPRVERHLAPDSRSGGCCRPVPHPVAHDRRSDRMPPIVPAAHPGSIRRRPPTRARRPPEADGCGRLWLADPNRAPPWRHQSGRTVGDDARVSITPRGARQRVRASGRETVGLGSAGQQVIGGSPVGRNGAVGRGPAARPARLGGGQVARALRG